jgi:hypothetical protein
VLGARSLAFSSFPGWRRPRPDDVALTGDPANRRGKQPLCGSTTGAVERPLAILQGAGGGRNRHQSVWKASVRTNIPCGDKVADERTPGLNDALSYRK